MEDVFVEQIQQAEAQLREAMLVSDVATLDQLLAPDLVFTNHMGQLLNKEADLAAHRSGALKISELDTSEQSVRRLADQAALVSVLVRLCGQYAGQPANGTFRFTRVWRCNDDGTWQVAAAHATLLT
ncbi:nuclear transport factor 2 family protein [Marinobacter xestospongiae]|uniref:Nuclear transport factor 2 family protein n=1 Tax=Marinobacter xestospongiae TaxID=994319 RepID=A0ABU3VY10_9GAMM|nr:nuclear transport factor 2 family protein [Marinobacter xestospongiae]MDV2079170.1 nuclear transport factor 2 family protein [Marinobacter xestospongiae]